MEVGGWGADWEESEEEEEEEVEEEDYVGAGRRAEGGLFLFHYPSPPSLLPIPPRMM